MKSRLFEKERAIGMFNRCNRVVKVWQLIEISVLFGLVSWFSARAPALLKLTGAFSNYLSNHHFVFLIGNVIIILLLTFFRENDVGSSGSDDYGEVLRRRDPDAAAALESGGGGGDCEKQIVVRAEDAVHFKQCEDLDVVMEKASRQIERFQRTQSEILKREIAVRRPQNLRKSNGQKADAEEIETLSNEEFRRRIDAFIDKHWSRKTTASFQLEGIRNYQLQKNASFP